MTILPALDITQIHQKELQPLDFVFKGFKTKTIGFLSSQGGTGKSMLALHIAGSIDYFILKSSTWEFFGL